MSPSSLVPQTSHGSDGRAVLGHPSAYSGSFSGALLAPLAHPIHANDESNRLRESLCAQREGEGLTN